MSIMSRLESVFCRSRPWQLFAGEIVLPRIARAVEWSGRVVELGGGSGAMADRLLTRESQIDELVLVDIDPAMVDQAARRLAHHRGRARAALGDGSGLPLEPRSADVVCSWLMLHHVLTWEDLLRDVAGVLVPGGRLVGYDLTDAVLGHALHGISRSGHRLVAPDDLTTELRSLGFVEVDVRSLAAGQVMTFHATWPGPPDLT